MKHWFSRARTLLHFCQTAVTESALHSLCLCVRIDCHIRGSDGVSTEHLAVDDPMEIQLVFQTTDTRTAKAKLRIRKVGDRTSSCKLLSLLATAVGDC
jgi:hypothetical protein